MVDREKQTSRIYRRTWAMPRAKGWVQHGAPIIHLNIAQGHEQGCLGGIDMGANSINDQPHPYPILRPLDHDTYSHRLNAHVIDRRVETQSRIRCKLDEACGHPGSIYGINIIAQVATDILSVIEVCMPYLPPSKLDILRA